jgi:hypothetical protein
MHVSPAPELARAAAGEVHKLARRLDPEAGGGGPTRKLLDALVANQPATYAIASLDGHLDLRSLSRPLDDILADAYAWGIVDLHVQPPALTIRPSERTRRQSACASAGAYARRRDDAFARARQNRRQPTPCGCCRSSTGRAIVLGSPPPSTTPR